jgi:hypothetical protein
VAWAIWQSHLLAWRTALHEEASALLVLEDDAEPCIDFEPHFNRFMHHVPSDWSAIYLGGQHLGPASKVSPGVLRCTNVNRAHAYILRPATIRFLFDALPATPTGNGHIDHFLGPLLGNTGTCYAPERFLIAQGANLSHNTGRREPYRLWSERPPPQIAGPLILVRNPPSTRLRGFRIINLLPVLQSPTKDRVGLMLQYLARAALGGDERMVVVGREHTMLLADLLRRSGWPFQQTDSL